MFIDEYFTNAEHGCLAGEFFDWLVMDAQPALGKRLWVLLSTDYPGSHEVCNRIGVEFLQSEDEDDLERRFLQVLRDAWPLVPTCTVQRQLDDEFGPVRDLRPRSEQRGWEVTDVERVEVGMLRTVIRAMKDSFMTDRQIRPIIEMVMEDRKMTAEQVEEVVWLIAPRGGKE